MIFEKINYWPIFLSNKNEKSQVFNYKLFLNLASRSLLKHSKFLKL